MAWVSIHQFVWAVLALAMTAVSAQAADDATPVKKTTNFAAANKVEKPAPAAPKPSAAAPAPAAQPKKDVAREAQKKRVEEKKTELNGSRWDISLTGAGPERLKEDDVLTFQDGKVAFRSFGEKGFGASNYTISVAEGSETAVWETMQTSPESGLLFVRGEWKDDQMNGVISHQNPDEPEKPAKDYTFSTQKKTVISPSSKEDGPDAKAGDAPATASGSVLTSGPANN